jgi:Ni/Co efflux regulator RcnB
MRLFLKPILAGVLAMSAIAPAFADQPRYDRHDNRRNDHDRDNRRWDNDRGHNHWYRGDRFDRRVRYVVVNDYRHYRLQPPRRGEYYVRTDSGDILLLAAATGLVLWALNN